MERVLAVLRGQRARDQTALEVTQAQADAARDQVRRLDEAVERAQAQVRELTQAIELLEEQS